MMITLKTFVFNNFSVNTYVLHDETKQAVIIDPACSSPVEFDELFKYFSQNNLQPAQVINTHAHIDHIVGVAGTCTHFEIPFLLHPEDVCILERAIETGLIFGFEIDKVPNVDKFLYEGEQVKFGNSTLEVLHVPGHSPGSLVFYSKPDGFAIVGDVLFNGSIGRTDLPKGDYDTLINGIKTKLLTLPGNTTVFCGHGPSTTIKKEHDTNPFLI